MKKLVIYTVMCICFLTCVNTCSAADIYVPDDYVTIQEAIDNTIAGDNVIIRDGTYVENITISTSISLRSENGSDHVTIRATSNTSRAITTTAQVNISGCHIELSKSGIYLDTGSSNSNISENIIENSSEYGIYVKTSDNCVVMNNVISGCGLDAIYLNNADNCNASNNNASFNSRGIYIASGAGNTIDTNTICNNSVYGIVLLFTNANTIYNNYFSGNRNDYLITFSTSSYNIAKTPGVNIIGGPYLGGNYWSSYTGIDTDSDGLGNTLTPYGPGDNLPLVYQPSIPSDILIFAQHRSAFIEWSDTTSMNPGPYTYNWNITNNTGEIINRSTVNTQTSKMDGLWPGWYNFSINVTDSRSGSMYTTIPFIMTNTADLKIDQPIIGTTGSDIGIIGVIGLFALLFIRRS